MAANVKGDFENGIPFIGLRTRRDDSEIENRILTGRAERKWIRSGRPDALVSFLLFIALTAGCHGYQEQRFAMEPQDQVNIYKCFKFRKIRIRYY